MSFTFFGTIPEPMEWQVSYSNGSSRRWPLPLCLEYVNHSPDGFAWGYEGSGPAQLAFAILYAYYGTSMAFRHYQDFKRRIIAQIDKDRDFTLTINEEVCLPIDGPADWNKIVTLTYVQPYE
jgi:hypothetical protein